METKNRKHTWVHITYEKNNNIEIFFATDYWRKGRYVRRHRRIVNISRTDWTRMSCLLRVLSYSPNVRYTIYAWNGYSVSYERRIQP